MSLTEQEIIVRDYINAGLQGEVERIMTELTQERMDESEDTEEAKSSLEAIKFSRSSKTEPVKAYMSFDDAMRVQARANKCGLSVSSYIRWLVMEDLRLNE
jgi:predicted DNA binding CopG/RHH family protein